MNILFICTGNVCRSLMAEILMNRLCSRARLNIDARSCGIAAERYFQPPQEVWRTLSALAIEPREHQARLVTRELLEWADLALAMTRLHRETVLDLYPEFTRKVHVLRRYAGLPDPDISDPIGQPLPFYESCRDRIIEALEALTKTYESQDPRP